MMKRFGCKFFSTKKILTYLSPNSEGTWSKPQPELNRFVRNKNRAKLGRTGSYNDAVGLLNSTGGRQTYNPNIHSQKPQKPINISKLSNANLGKEGVVAYCRNTGNLKKLNENGV